MLAYSLPVGPQAEVKLHFVRVCYPDSESKDGYLQQGARIFMKRKGMISTPPLSLILGEVLLVSLHFKNSQIK